MRLSLSYSLADAAFCLAFYFTLQMSLHYYQHLLHPAENGGFFTIGLIIFFIIFIFLSNHKMDEFSSIILSVFRYVAVYPLLLFAGLIDGGTIFMVYVTFFYLAFHLFIQFNLSINEEILALDRRSIFFILMMLFILVLFLVFQKNGLPSTQAFNLRNIYKVRSEYQSSPVLTLIKSFVIYFAIPWMLIFYRSFGFLLSIICATFIFMSSGGKLFLAMTLFVSVCVYLCKYGKITYVRLVLVLPVLISMLCYINQVQFVAHYLFFRPFVVPAWFSVEYYNYALENGFYFYTDNNKII
mgnify:CR=1 FL=1